MQGRRFFGLAKEQGSSLARAARWQSLRREGSFSATASNDQGLLTAIAADMDQSRFTQDSIVNRTTRWMVGGPMTGSEWQKLRAMNVGIYPRFTIFNGHLYATPAFTSGQSVYFDYMSKYWALSGGTVEKATFTADTDQYNLDDALMELGLKWRIEKQLGQDIWEADKLEYEREVFKMAAQDAGGKRAIDTTGDGPVDIPSAQVPEGSWMQ